MELNYTIMLVVASICAIGGLGFGYLIGKQQQPDEPSQPPPPVIPRSVQYPADALHIWRDHEQKQLVLKIKENTFRSMEPLPAAEQKFLQQLLSYLSKWINTPIEPAPDADTPQATASPQPTPIAHRTVEPIDAVISNKSIVEQINDILQEKLLTSSLRERGISLTQTISGGMVIYVGLNKYEEIDAIPDQDVVAMIRASVKAWEQQQ